MKETFDQQMKRLKNQEEKLLSQHENRLIRTTITPVTDKIQSIIPNSLKSTLNSAFYKGFQLVFEKGTSIIEKTYSKEKLETEYDINNYAMDRKANKRHMKRLDKQSKQTQLINNSISLVEGGALGFLVIGIPDIPLFLSVIMKTIYEIALSYGYEYQSEEDKTYILLLISAAITKGSTQLKFNEDVDKLGAQIDQNIVISVNLKEQMKTTSDHLSDALLTAKFIQGIPLVGVVGGAVNLNLLNRISTYASLKYKKRYLMKKLGYSITDN